MAAASATSTTTERAPWFTRLWRRVAASSWLLWPLVITLMASALFFHRLSDRALEKSDEAVFAAGSLEIARNAGYWYPQTTFTAVDKIGKPPGGMWPAALSMSIFGRSKLALRLPVALAGILVVLMVYLLAATISGSRLGGVIAACLLMSHPAWFKEAKVIWLENYLTANFLIAIYLDQRARVVSSRRWRILLQIIIGVCIGHSLLTKHLVGLAPLGAIVLAELVINPTILWHPRQLVRRFAVSASTAAGLFGIWLLHYIPDKGHRAAGAQIAYKLSPDKSIPRKPNDFWDTLTRIVEPWVIIAGLVCFVVLLFALYARQNKRHEQPQLSQQTATLIAVVSLLGCFGVVFGFVAEKLRLWYVLPIVPLFSLGIGALLGYSLTRLGKVVLPVAIAVLGTAWVFWLGDGTEWVLVFLVIVAVGLLLLLLKRLSGLLPDQLVRLQIGHRLQQASFALVTVAILSAGLQKGSAQAWHNYGKDQFEHYQKKWSKDPPDRLIVDNKNWRRRLYFTPTVYFYYSGDSVASGDSVNPVNSPMVFVPKDLKTPCDISDIRPGEFVMVHWTLYDCIRPRARKMRTLSRWWRMAELH